MASEMKVLTWEGCYRDNWNGLIVPEAFSHPAKFAPGLIRRIFQHCLEQGYLHKGETVLDCFGGIGAGGIMAAPMGLKWVGCELEEKLVSLAQQNFALHVHAWETMGYPMPVILQGDSRHLSDIVIGQVDGIVTSPPFSEPGSQPPAIRAHCPVRNKWKDEPDRQDDYGHSPGQIGNLKSGSVEAVITSPPYAESLIEGTTGGRMGNGGQGTNWRKKWVNTLESGYSSSPSNIGNLKAGDVAAVVTSPPYEGSDPSASHGQGKSRTDPNSPNFRPIALKDWDERSKQRDYGESKGQIGNDKGDTYWQAVSDVYRECFKILKPSGIMCVVVKSYVKAGRRVPLPMQTLKLLIHLGFTPLERIKAMLVEETSTPGLFGEITKKKERKSFFRRLAEKKGSPEINWEEVLVVRKP